jgi:hypothetical protein
MTPTSDPLRDFLKHAGQASIAPRVTAGSYRLWLEDRESFLAHAAARAAELERSRPKPLTLVSHSPEARAAARAEHDQKAQIIKPAPGARVLRTAGGQPMTLESMGDTLEARNAGLAARIEREQKDRLNKQAAENAARRAAAAAAGDLPPTPTPEQQSQHIRDVEAERAARGATPVKATRS